MYYATKYMTYQDMPEAWAQAAQQLVDAGVVPSWAVTAVDSAWSAVDIQPQLRLVAASGQSRLQVGASGDLKLVAGHQKRTYNWAAYDPFRILHDSDTCLGLRQDSSSICLEYADSLSRYDSLYLDTASLAGQ